MSHEDKLQFEPQVQGLTEVKVVTGEEEEDTVFKMRARLFRFAREAVSVEFIPRYPLCSPPFYTRVFVCLFHVSRSNVA